MCEDSLTGFYLKTGKTQLSEISLIPEKKQKNYVKVCVQRCPHTFVHFGRVEPEVLDVRKGKKE